VSPEVVAILMLVALIVGLIVLGIHLGFWLCLVALLAGFIGWGGTDWLHLIPIRIWQIMSNYVLVAIPLFVFMGYMLEMSGLGEDLFGGGEFLLGKFRGGMAIMVIIVTTMTAACTGIVATGVVMAGVLAIPPMLRRGYNKGLALGSVAAGGTLGILIPPSTDLVLYAALSGLSVGKLFLGAFAPGFVLSGLFISYIAIITTIRPKLAPKYGEVEEVELPGWPQAANPLATSAHPRLRALRGVIPVLILIMAVLGSIILGIATPTEAAACGAAGAMVIAAAYKKLNFRNLWDTCRSTVGTMGMFGGVMIGAMTFTAVFAGLGGRRMMFELLMGLNIPPIGVLLVILAMVVAAGMFLDDVAMLFLFLPIVLPIQAAMGWPEIWFALVFFVTMQTAWLTPPFGYALFFLRGLNLPGITFADIAKGCIPFIFLQLIGVGFCIAFPQIILFLPTLLIK